MKLEDKTNNNIISQAVDGFDITPSDTTVFQAAPLYIGTGGNIKVVTHSGTTLTFTNTQDGSILPVMCTKVFDTDTTADDIIGLI